MTLSYMSGLDDGRIIYASYLESLTQSIRGRYVLNGCEVSANDTTLSVDVNTGTVVYNGDNYNVENTNITLEPAIINKDRVDVIVWEYNDTGPILKVITGTRWITLSDGSIVPITDRIADNQIPLAIIKVNEGVTLLETFNVIDIRSGFDSINYIGNLKVNLLEANEIGNTLRNIIIRNIIILGD